MHVYNVSNSENLEDETLIMGRKEDEAQLCQAQVIVLDCSLFVRNYTFSSAWVEAKKKALGLAKAEHYIHCAWALHKTQNTEPIFTRASFV